MRGDVGLKKKEFGGEKKKMGEKNRGILNKKHYICLYLCIYTNM